MHLHRRVTDRFTLCGLLRAEPANESRGMARKLKTDCPSCLAVAAKERRAERAESEATRHVLDRGIRRLTRGELVALVFAIVRAHCYDVPNDRWWTAGPPLAEVLASCPTLAKCLADAARLDAERSGR